MSIVPLTEVNFLLLAAQNYDSVFPDTLEFYEDLKRIVYIKRLLNTYVEKGEIKERLILNHLIVLYNMFGNHATRMLFLKLEPRHLPALKSFLKAINRLPDNVKGIGVANKSFSSCDIEEDTFITSILKT